jgi:outer membrane lipoprotein-sorting protein
MQVLHLATISLLTLPVLFLSAQPFPDGSAILKQSSEALQSYQSYELTQLTTTEPMSMTMTMHFQSAKPAKMRLEMTMMGMGFTMVSDGKNSWMHSAATKSYMKLPSESDIDVAGITAMLGIETPSGEAKLIRSEAIDVDGVSHDCWVVETADKSTKYWIDKVQGLQLQIDRSQKVAGAGEVHSRTITQSITLNPALPDSLFVFTPPEGFKETDEIFPGMKAMMSKPKVVDAAHVPAAHTAPAPEPQAFVPSLMPLEQPDATYPEAARAKNIHGLVQVLVTIGPTGAVVNVEPLTGPEILRPAALDAAKQFRYRPVIRAGRPVFAATQTHVSFRDQGPGKPEDFAIDMEQEMALVQRLGQLQEKFPRSPQQVLADLEQDRDDSGPRRLMALPELAKAAFDAGMFDKAAEYANEALRPSHDDFNHADAMNQANTVLGMIAFKEGNVSQAKHYLNESANTGRLDFPGPSMRLAKQLLEGGERDVVLEYLEACRKSWGAQQLDEWIGAIKAGRRPDFGFQLLQ